MYYHTSSPWPTLPRPFSLAILNKLQHIKPLYVCNHILVSVLGGLSNCLKHWLVERDYIRFPSLSVHPLGTEGWDGQLGQRPIDGIPWDVPSLSVHPLGTEGWDGQL